MMRGLLTFLIGGIAVAAASDLAKSKRELEMASGGSVDEIEPSRYDFKRPVFQDEISELWIDGYRKKPSKKQVMKDLSYIKSRYREGSEYANFSPVIAVVYPAQYGWTSSWKVNFSTTDKNSDRVFFDEVKGKREVYKLMASGGGVEGLEKELRRLQRELNSSRLGTYIEGDNSEEAKALRREREVKLARFNEVLRLLRESEPKLSKGGSIQKGDLVHVPSINKSGFVYNVDKKNITVKLSNGVLNVYDRNQLEKIKELAQGGTIGQYQVIGYLRFIEAPTPDNEVRVSTNVVANSEEDAIKKVKKMYGLDVAPDSDLYAELVESYE